MGRNGAGKTTLLRSIVGVHEPSRGSIEVDGHPPRPGVDVALCPQEPEVVLFAETVGDEVRATRQARELPDDPMPVLHATRSASPISPLCTPATSRPGSACSSRPPRSRRRRPGAAARRADAGWTLSKERLAGFLRSHAARGGLAMVATHDVELAAAVATRVVILAGGEVIADGDPGLCSATRRCSRRR